MYFLGYVKVGEKEGGIRYNPETDSYIVWIREKAGEKQRDMIPAYGNGVAAQKRLDDEMSKGL